MNPTLIYGFTMLLFVLGLLIGSNADAYSKLAYEYEPPIGLDECANDEWRWGWGTCLDLATWEQNNYIIKQNNWLICAELHKKTASFGGAFDNTYATNREKLIDVCGETP